MYKIRQISYTSGSVSIQVYKIENRKRIIIKHIGTARTDFEKTELLKIANQFIQNISKQITLFEQQDTSSVLNLSQADFIGTYYGFLYETLAQLFNLMGFNTLKNQLLMDLSIIRIVEPASKLRSIELLKDYFGISHRRQNYYTLTQKWEFYKNAVENTAVKYAKKHYNFAFDLVFYDVTTLYFETFTADELRKTGFSKDNKSQQPQIMIALMVTRQGLPISYQVFTGNTFEGHTLIPVVKAFITKHKIKTFTVVADAAMISATNIEALKKEKGLHYIVGARLGNLSQNLVEQISTQIEKKDGHTIRVKTKLGYLICSFSSQRYRKDKYEMEKQINKAKEVIKNPGKSKKLKFTKTENQTVKLNQKLIDKTQKLLGIKGYYTNLSEQSVSNQTIINRYHQLYKIEQAFRVSKHDLQTRPIYHFDANAIQLHLVICFIALVISKEIELKTEISIRSFLIEARKVKDGRLKNNITNQDVIIRSKIGAKLNELLIKLNLLT